MSIGPVPGNGIAISLPAGKTVFWTVNAQASWPQYVALVDSGGHALFVASGSSTGGHSPTQIGAGSFVASDPGGNYRLFVGRNQGQAWSSVLWDTIDLTLDGKILARNMIFVSEDGADRDFNDSYVSITWFDRLG